MNKTILALAAIAASAAQMSHAQTLRLACPSAATSPTCLTAERFAEAARERSEGTLNIQVFPGGQLGSGETAIQQMRAGVLDFVVEDITNYGNFVDDYNVVSWGFAFRDEDHFLAFLDSDLHAEMREALRNQGIETIAADWRNLPRVVVSTTPIHTPEDLAGLRFRVPPIPAYIATWSTLGTNPTQVPWSDSFQALRTGMVDAMETPLASIPAQSFHLAAPYVSLTNHVYSSFVLAMNGPRFNSLDDDSRQILAEAAAEAAEYSADMIATAAENVFAELQEGGATIIEVDQAAFSAVLRDAALEQESDGLWAEGLYDRIQDVN